jgi:hypothetical protein
MNTKRCNITNICIFGDISRPVLKRQTNAICEDAEQVEKELPIYRVPCYICTKNNNTCKVKKNQGIIEIMSYISCDMCDTISNIDLIAIKNIEKPLLSRSNKFNNVNTH